MMLYAGIMSGTSCDGIDVALVDFNDGVKVVATAYEPYPKHIKQLLTTIVTKEAVGIESLSQLDAELGCLYATSLNQLLKDNSIDPELLLAIGLHGQTIHHQTSGSTSGQLPNTIQLGSAPITAQKTGKVTVANFRQMDLAHGGQGAPLAPIFHQQLFYQPGKHVVVLNLGGIANISLVNDDGVVGFDTGPANCLMDEFIKNQQGLDFDLSGQWAQLGEVNDQLLTKLLSEPYFSKKFPKSTGRELFNLLWLVDALEDDDLKPEDIQRTLLQLTAETVVMGIEQLNRPVDEVVVCGGGAHNTFLLKQLNKKLDCPVFSSDQYNVSPDFIEAVLMAWLAQQNIKQNKLDLRSITGVDKPLLYGVQHDPS